MSSSLSGGTNALNFNVVKSSSSTLTSLTSSSLTISEPSNNISQSAIRTKRTRTNRKRPNQKYNEAAELLSEAYPNLFRNLKKIHPPPCKFSKPLITECYNNDFFEPLLLPFSDFDYANSFSTQNKSASQTEVFSFQEKEVSEERVVNSGEVLERDSGEALDCISMLDDETEEGIDSIIGSRVEDYAGNSGGDGEAGLCYGGERVNPWFRGFGRKLGIANALRGVGGVNLLSFAMVDVLEISKVPVAVSNVPVTGKKKQRKKENLERRNLSLDLPLRLKLDYEDVRSLWSARGSPFRR
ncbi:protein CHLOROPLAST IMPORT APPARATUS 2-like [Vicia villosa]|uniref:protein CHLOROPLAST IMPORT APPARATUS 2-like n=1 Tax=Vicia villosa TaxID=3911 RepID=UPI00273ADA62|nr:protein CHLOROPLAST IMPORT APPARATUS 2-like [Vicia villosa]